MHGIDDSPETMLTWELTESRFDERQWKVQIKGRWHRDVGERRDAVLVRSSNALGAKRNNEASRARRDAMRHDASFRVGIKVTKPPIEKTRRFADGNRTSDIPSRISQAREFFPFRDILC